MKRILFLLLSFSMLQANAINVSGVISTNTTWTKANSPYIVIGNLTVDSAVVLTIEPGVVVKVDSGFTFNIDGKLMAEGTITDIITFTANKSNPTKKSWAGITFSIKSVDTSKINYCLFEYGNSSVRTTGAKMSINNSVFRHNTTAIYINSVPYPYNDYVLINKCLLTRNETGLYDTGNRQIVSKVTENEFSYNTVGLLEANSRGLNNFNYNDFNYNVVGYSSNGGKFGSRLNNFKGNIAYGVYVNCPTPSDVGYVSEGKFLYNTTAVYINNASGGNIYSNVIAYNGIGVHDNFTSTTGNRTLVQMFANCYHKNTSYHFREDGRFSVNTNGDWWGTNSAPGIDSFIYDFYDNPSSAIINYSNRATTGTCQTVSPPPPCFPPPSSVTANSTSTSTATISWPSVSGAYAYEYYFIPVSSTPPSSGIFTFDTAFSETSLTPGQTYKVCVRTRCLVSPFSSAWMYDTITMPTSTCDSPATIVITNLSAHSAVIKWNSVKEASGYEYYLAVSPSTPPSTGTIASDTTSSLSGLEPVTTYDFCVRTICGTQVPDWKCKTFTTSATGIEQRAVDNFVKVYPNPSNGTFNISLNNGFDEHTVITVYDITGRLIVSKQMNTANETISIGNAAKGVYTIRIVTDNAVVNKRIVIE